MLDCVESYKLNTATAGTALADATFVTQLTGKAQRVVHGSVDGGFPNIKCVLGVESLVAGAATRIPGFVILSGRGGGLNSNEDRYMVPIPWSAIGTTELGHNPDERGRRYDENMVNMPWPEGSTLCDGTVSKAYGAVANSYQAFVLYRQFGAKCEAPKGGRVVIIKYDKGGDNTTVAWSTVKNTSYNAAGELLPDHKYRLLWTASLSEDAETNLIRVTTPGYPPLIAPACGAVVIGNAALGGARRVYFIDDSIMMRGDAIHHVEVHIGAVQQPVIYLGWEDMGKA